MQVALLLIVLVVFDIHNFVKVGATEKKKELVKNGNKFSALIASPTYVCVTCSSDHSLSQLIKPPPHNAAVVRPLCGERKGEYQTAVARSVEQIRFMGVWEHCLGIEGYFL